MYSILPIDIAVWNQQQQQQQKKNLVWKAVESLG